uniref:Uncharacterized protein LOC111133096 n=1 Tax=Crassostrea virginica TaxID=6565 RepID=A0A8B8E9T9_CRAVI|nr:uncharacterized protein LOC111133096 [Crassostrea virginica]
MWIFLAKICLLISSIIGNQRVVGNSTLCRRYSSGCCLNEYKDDGKCKECPPGTFGVNCSSECYSGFYGQLCLQECGCAHNHYCDHRYGCQKCPPRTFGLNCSGTCPNKYYGRLCQEECDCALGQYCDPRNGCIQCAIGQLCRKDCNCTSEEYCDPRYGCLKCSTRNKGLNCSQTCPNEYYGGFCLEKCNCTTGQYCDPQKGCLECAVGTVGGECNRHCSTGYYGKTCQTECDCTSYQYCDPKYGCLQKLKATPTTTPRITTSDSPIWKNVSFSFFGFIFATVVVGGLFCLKPRLKDLFRIPVEDTERSSGVRPELADDDAEAASGNAHEYLQEEAIGNVDNVYADLRTSKMVDCAVINDSEPVDDGNRHRKLNYAHTREENYDLCTLEAVSDENTMHDYACVPKNFQYSILSLKRNVDPSLLVDLEAQPKGPVDGAYDLIDICGQTYHKSSDDNSSESDSNLCMSDSEVKSAVDENGSGK